MYFSGMLQALWRRHYIAGVTGSFHGDMAMAFRKILDDGDCDDRAKVAIRRSVMQHRAVESSADYIGRRWFSDLYKECF